NASMQSASGGHPDMGALYRTMPQSLKPQLRLYFDQAINGEAPLVVNCSAGQDRTGIASALMLSALGVPREVILADYQLSTEFRRPQVERGDVDLAAAAKTNDFAKMMLRYASAETTKASPLVVNCSAGQDRTGIASALMLSALGVPREVILADYQLSTEFRRPQVERGDVDLAAAAKTNDFAKMMLRYASAETTKASPLVT